MRYKVVVQHSDEGVGVSVPGLPGCWSQGADEKEALENGRSAIEEYLAVVQEQTKGTDVREVEVTVSCPRSLVFHISRPYGPWRRWAS